MGRAECGAQNVFFFLLILQPLHLHLDTFFLHKASPLPPPTPPSSPPTSSFSRYRPCLAWIILPDNDLASCCSTDTPSSLLPLILSPRRCHQHHPVAPILVQEVHLSLHPPPPRSAVHTQSYMSFAEREKNGAKKASVRDSRCSARRDDCVRHWVGGVSWRICAHRFAQHTLFLVEPPTRPTALAGMGLSSTCTRTHSGK